MADFYLDHNVAVDLASLLQASGHVVVTAHDAGRGRATDDEHLLFATDLGAILVSHNRRDFVLLHGAWRRWTSAWGVTRTHAGILIVPQPPIVTTAEITDALDAFVRRGLSPANELYRWRRAGGWQRYT